MRRNTLPGNRSESRRAGITPTMRRAADCTEEDIASAKESPFLVCSDTARACFLPSHSIFHLRWGSSTSREIARYNRAVQWWKRELALASVAGVSALLP